MFKMKARRKFSRMSNPPKQSGPNDELDLYRKHTMQDANTMDTERQQLGPKVLKDTLEAMKLEYISKLEEKQHPTLEHNNLTRNERLTLKELASNHDLIINKANKGSNIVIKDRSDYVEEGIQHLSNENTYLSLDRDHTAKVTKFVKHTARPQEGRSTVTKNGKILYATDQCQNCHHILSEKDTQKWISDP